MRFMLIALSILLAWAGTAWAEAGLRRLSYVDPGRGSRSPINVWYPTAAPEQSVRRGPFTLSVAPDGPVADGRHPLVVISHGSGGTAHAHADTAIALARRGYIVAALHHSGNAFEDNSNAGKAGMWQDRPRQLSAALDAVLADPEVGPRVDGKRIGALGLSAGGYTVLVVAGGIADIGHLAKHCAARPDDTGFCGIGGRQGPGDGIVAARDPRIRAVVVMAPVGALFADDAFSGVTIPIRLYGAEKDDVTTTVHHAERIKSLLPVAPEYEIVPNAGHYAFMMPFPVAIAAEVGPPALDPPGFDRAAFHERLNAEVAAFFDRTMPDSMDVNRAPSRRP